ncbi:MAG: type II toxin-antitoxin system VapC family toxin [Acinetobacter sp.]|nr:type II toxin-antitoxin system VapC family toxin [Acinetobacter sp.]
MNGAKYLLDTCFIIQWHAQHQQAFELIRQFNLSPEICFYSDITHAELFGYHGITSQAENELKFLLSDIERIPVSRQVIDRTIQLRKQYKIKLPDSLILATAQTYQLTLITLDDKLNKISKIF